MAAVVPTIGQVLASLSNTKQEGSAWRATCPACQQPHLIINLKGGNPVVSCKTEGCPKGAAWKLIYEKIASGAPQNVTEPPPTRKPLTTVGWGWPERWDELSEPTYAKLAQNRPGSHMARRETLLRYGFRERKLKDGTPVFAYPITSNGKLLSVKWGMVDRPEGKWNWKQFAPPPPHTAPTDTLFGLDQAFPELKPGQIRYFPYVFIVEGQWDAMCLADLGHPSVAIGTAKQTTIRKDIVERITEAKRIYLVPDNDANKAGAKMEELAALFPPDKIFIIDLKDTGAKDFCEMVHKYPAPSVETSTDESGKVVSWRRIWPVQDALERLIGSKRKPKETIRFKGFLALPLGDVQPKVADWLWERRLHRGKLNMIVGLPEQGKGLHLVAIAAAVATGKDWPDGRKNTLPPSTVLFMSTEDSENDLAPRFMALGLNKEELNRIIFIPEMASGQPFSLSLESDLQTLRDNLQRNPDVQLVIFDPITPYLGAKVKSTYSDAEVRAVLDPLQKLAHEFGVSIVAVHHFNKQRDAMASCRTGAAGAFQQIPHAVWACVKDPDDESIGYFLCSKLKHGGSKDREGYEYKFQGIDVQLANGRDNIGIIRYARPTGALKLDEVLQRRPKEGTSAGAAEQFIKEYLADGEAHDSDEMERAAIEAGIAKGTYRKSKAGLGKKGTREIMTFQKEGEGGWYSQLRTVPGARPSDDELENPFEGY
jgi:hypothetical protein